MLMFQGRRAFFHGSNFVSLWWERQTGAWRWKVSVFSVRLCFIQASHWAVAVWRWAAKLNTAVLLLLLLYSPGLYVSYLKGFVRSQWNSWPAETLYVFRNWQKWLMSSSMYGSAAYWHRCFRWLSKSSDVGWNYVWNFIEVNNRYVQFNSRKYMRWSRFLPGTQSLKSAFLRVFEVEYFRND